MTKRESFDTICFGELKSFLVYADMAQSVAHLIGSEEVTGSIPVNSFREGIEPCKIKETPRVSSSLVKL